MHGAWDFLRVNDAMLEVWKNPSKRPLAVGKNGKSLIQQGL